jgi:tetratricopeptide (TPR) repeat protein
MVKLNLSVKHCVPLLVFYCGVNLAYAQAPQESMSMPMSAAPAESDGVIVSGLEDGQTVQQSSLPVIGFVPKESLKAFKQSQAHDQRNKDLENMYQYAYDKQSKGFTNLAVFAYKKVLTHYPLHEKASIALARIYTDNKNYNAAIEVLLPLTNTQNSHWSVWYWLSYSLLKKDEFELAIHCAEKALVRQPENADVWLLRALIEQELGDHNSALQLLSVARQHSPENMLILLNIAYSNDALGEYQRALQAYAQYLKTGQSNNNTHAMDSFVLNRIRELSVES